jgi:VanZ family protein
MLILFMFSSIPGEWAPLRDTSVLNIKITNILHIPAFTVLFFLWIWALKGLLLNLRNCYLCALAISILFGVFLEIYQTFVPGRYSSLSDILLNITGVLVGVILANKWSKILTKGIQVYMKPNF